MSVISYVTTFTSVGYNNVAMSYVTTYTSVGYNNVRH